MPNAIDQITAEARDAGIGFRNHHHGAFGMTARRHAAQSGQDLLTAGTLQVKQPESSGCVQPIDQMLDVLGRIRWA